MPKPGQFQKGADSRRSPGGLTAEARRERIAVESLLLTRERDLKWLEAYEIALCERIPAIVLDYTYRRLGKPAEVVQVQDDGSTALRGLGEVKLLALIDKVLLTP